MVKKQLMLQRFYVIEEMIVLCTNMTSYEIK